MTRLKLLPMQELLILTPRLGAALGILILLIAKKAEVKPLVVDKTEIKLLDRAVPPLLLLETRNPVSILHPGVIRQDGMLHLKILILPQHKTQITQLILSRNQAFINHLVAIRQDGMLHLKILILAQHKHPNSYSAGTQHLSTTLSDNVKMDAPDT